MTSRNTHSFYFPRFYVVFTAVSFSSTRRNSRARREGGALSWNHFLFYRL